MSSQNDPRGTQQSSLTTESELWNSMSHELRQAITQNASYEDVQSLHKETDPVNNLEILQSLANMFRNQSKYQVSAKILGHILSIKRNAPSIGPQHSDTLETMFELAQAQGSMGDYPQAEDTWVALLEIYKKLGDQEALAVMYNLAVVFNKQEKYAEAEKLLVVVLPQLRAGIGKNSQQAIGTLRELSIALVGQGRVEEAKTLISQGLEELAENEDITQDDKEVHMKKMEKVQSRLPDSLTSES